MPVERTTLAWLRTTLAFMVGAVIMTRLLANRNAALAIVHAVLAFPLAVAVTWSSWRRTQHSRRSLQGRASLPDGVLPVAVGLLAVVVGTAGLTYVLLTE